MAMDTQTGPRARDAGRLLLPVERLQPRHPGAAPAGLVVQALRLCRGARQRLQPGDDRARRADRGGDRRRHLEAGELGQHLLRPDADAHRHRAVAQPDDRAHRPGHRHGHRRALRRAASASTTTCRSCSAIRSARARRRSTRWSRPMPSSPTAGSRSSRRWSTGCRTATARPSTATTSAPARAAPPTTSPTPAQPLVHSNAERVMDAITAYQVTSMLQGAVSPRHQRRERRASCT